MRRRQRHFSPDGRGRFRTQLRANERELLRHLPEEALGILGTSHPAVRRLRPVAYVDDDAAEAEYQQAVGASLVDARRHALQSMAESADEPVIDGELLQLWLQAIEALRLVLGTHLDVSEDMDLPSPSDPRATPLAVYHYLSALQDEAIQSLSTLLPDVPDEDDDDPLGSEPEDWLGLGLGLGGADWDELGPGSGSGGGPGGGGAPR